jgi:hypothetical protein
MLGAQIRNRRLGWCVDTTRPDAIKEGLLRFLDRTSDYGFDPAAARTFASENTEEAMASTVFSHILAAS